MKVRIKKIAEDVIIPQYETPGAAGFDFHAYLKEPYVLKAGKRYAVPTGLIFEIPEGYELQIRARSGLAARNGITMMNGVGTIDSDFRGEVHVLLVNHGEEDFVIEPGMRIAQGLFNRIDQVDFELTDEEFSETKRGKKGFGSTGV
jgi:dUTP pyrophosphatase